MAYTDFVVNYDPQKDSSEVVTKRIFYSLFVKRLKDKKPCVIFISGDSGEGKSWASIKFQDLLLEIQGLDLLEYFNDVNVYTPLEYGTKLDALLFDKKRLKKVNIICMHEAREIVSAKQWRLFITQTVADVNAESRAVKRLAIIIISQFIRDITTDMRYTLHYYIKARRPRGHPARLYISKMWKDDRDLEKPKLRKRRIMGYLRHPNGRYQRYMPDYLEVSRPRKELTEVFEKSDFEAKGMLIRRKLARLIKEIKQDVGEDSNKIEAMVEWYTAHTENLKLIGKRYKSGIRLSQDFQEMHDLDKQEIKIFEKRLNEKLIKMHYMEKEDSEAEEGPVDGVESNEQG